MSYSIGLDVGIQSVGYAILALDKNDAPYRIIKLGSRIFDKAENPKDGASLATPRREARSMRRRLRRKRHRKERIYGLLRSSGILTDDELAHLYEGKLPDVYELRVKALDEALTNKEFARVLIHIAQRRGFKSNRKSVDEGSKESGKILSAISKNQEICAEKGYRTIGELLYHKESRRNKGDDYSSTVMRSSVEDEVKLIFAAQRKFGTSFASEETELKYLDILLSQRSFAEGPGSGPYSGNQIERMIGKCTFEPNEYRAAKATYSFQLFNLWQHINHMRISASDRVAELTPAERRAIFDYAHAHSEVTYLQIRKLIGLSDDAVFVDVRYGSDKDASEKKKKLNDLKVYHDIRKCLNSVSGALFASLSYEQLDAIGTALSKNYSDDDIDRELSAAGICTEARQALLKLPNYSKYGHISVKACKKIIPYLESGMTYDKACDSAGYKFNKNKTEVGRFLPPVDRDDNTITNPVVLRAVSQSIKVVNAIIREMNESPVYINIELARELSKDINERKKTEKSYLENAEKNERLMQQIREYGIKNPTGQDLVKFRLWNEQGGICPYSQETMSITRLFEPGYVDVDHIVPYSRSFDDRNANKVLVLTRENRQKGSRLPLEYMTGEKRERFIVWVKSQNFSPAKKALLLKEHMADEDGWKKRNLQDTQYISTFLYNHIADHLEFAPSSSGKIRRVFTVNGAVTSYVRKRWGITKIRADGDLHHAVDAVVIGCISQKMLNVISRYSYYIETVENGDFVVDTSTGEVTDRFPLPWREFRDELSIRLIQDDEKLRKFLKDVHYASYSDVDLDTVRAPFVSRMGNHKITGSAHAQTIKSARYTSEGISLLKTDLKALRLDADGEIKGYYNPDSDRLLYEALKKRLVMFGGNAKTAFDEPFYKPRSDGSRGPLVKKVKLFENYTSAVSVADDTGIASNETMVRCDVFYVEGEGYYYVPVYVADTVKKELPNLACVANKKQWKEMSDDNFVFSLYKNDLIRLYSKKPIILSRVSKDGTLDEKMTVSGEDGVMLYYSCLDISTGLVSAETHDNTYKIRSIGKTVLRLEKYEVDVLGNIRRAGKEKRQKFNKSKRRN